MFGSSSTDHLERRIRALEDKLDQIVAQLGIDLPEPSWVAEARRLMSSGHKIEAIKYVREQTGMGLAEAKQAVEEL